jgi:hypothetical protein
MNETNVEPGSIELNQDKLLGFQQIAAFDAGTDALTQALDEIDNKIGEVTF